MSHKTYLIAYDVVCDKKRKRLHKSLCECGYPIQFSVFALNVSLYKMKSVWKELLDIVDEEDNLFCVTIHNQGFYASNSVNATSKIISVEHDCGLFDSLLNKCYN